MPFYLHKKSHDSKIHGAIWLDFELFQDIIALNILTKFGEDLMLILFNLSKSDKRKKNRITLLVFDIEMYSVSKVENVKLTNVMLKHLTDKCFKYICT